MGFSFSLLTLVELLHPKISQRSRARRDHEVVTVHTDDAATGFEEALKRRRNNLSARIVAKKEEEQ